jgi:hypothetical protein
LKNTPSPLDRPLKNHTSLPKTFQFAQAPERSDTSRDQPINLWLKYRA